MLLGTSKDDDVLYAAGFLHQALGYTVVSANDGNFEPEYFRTSQMRASIGSINNRRGHRFNEEVAEVFRQHGFQARSAVGMVEFEPPLELGDMGDVDVLAWTEQGVVFIVECKNLRFAMTIGEIAEQLSRFKGDPTDELGRHLARFNWLRENSAKLGRVIKVKDSLLSLRALLVTNTVVPMQFVQGLPIPSKSVVSFNQLDSVIGPLSGETSD